MFGRKKIWQIKNPKRALARIERLQDQRELAGVVSLAQDKVLRVAALNRITDQNLLAELACNLGTANDSIVLRFMACERLTDPAASQKAYFALARDIPPYPAQGIESLGLQALRQLTDQDRILDIAARAPNKKIRGEAMILLTGQVALAEFAIRCRDDDSGEVLPQIYLEELLDRVARRACNPNTRAEACKMLGGHRWDGCQCDRCKAARKEGHNWVTEEVTVEEGGGYTEDWVLRGEPYSYTRTYCTRCWAEA